MKIRIIVTLLSLFVVSHELVFGQDLQLSISGITCNGLCDGNATVSLLSTVNCGNGPYQYQIIGPSPSVATITSPLTSATTYTFANLCAGNYSVDVLVGGNVCTNGGFNIFQPPSLYTTISTTLPLCAGNDGSALITVNGGATGSCVNNCRGYNVLWTGPGGIGGGSLNACPKEIVTCSQSSPTNTYSLTNLSPGTYNVTVEDNNNCPVSTSFTITPPPPPITVSGLAANNAIDITVSGGTPGYTYSWSNGATTQDLTNLPPGTYTVSVIDANNCTVAASYTVQNQNPVLTVTSTISQVLCAGGQDGSINVSTAGGNAPYNVSWTGPVFGNPAGNEIAQSGGSYLIANMPAGIYTVTVTDANGNSTTISATITQPQAPLTLSTVTTNILCYGGQTGNIDLTVSGGTGVYTYSWNTGAITQDINGLAAGLYMVTVIDANGCVQTQNVVLNNPAQLIVSATSTPASCNGGNDGTIIFTATGGTGGLNYSTIPATGSGVALSGVSDTILGVSAGIYQVLVVDGNGCQDTLSVVVNEPNSLLITETITQISCNGANNGGISITPSGGSGGYTYGWTSVPAGYSSSNGSISSLAPGTYVLLLTDGNGCTATETYTINEPPALNLQAPVTSLINCFGQTGSITATVTGGTANYTLTGIGAPQTLTAGSPFHMYTGLVAGTYTITVTDANNCTMQGSINITQPPLLTITGTTSNNNIDISVSGGTAPYVYLWSNGATTEDLTNLSPGTYTVTVIDANNCTVTASYTVQNQNPVLSITSAISPVSCAGGQDGSIIVTAAGGNAPYNVSWTGPVSGNPAGNEIANSGVSYLIANLPAGIYTVTVTDANGNSTNISATITQPSALQITLNGTTNILCNGGNNGSINVTVSGGTGGYTYLWSSGQTSEDLTNLIAGTYTLTVIDANGCTAQASYTITQPQSPLTLTTALVNVLCNGANTGSINLTPTGGIPLYTYLWSNGSTLQDPQNLVAGTYSVTVTDANGCTDSVAVTITQPQAPLTLSTVTTNILCYGGQTGNIDLTVSGGTAAYTYAWSNGATTQDINNLAAGTYSITVADANNCTEQASATITQPQVPLTVSSTQVNVLCYGANTGSIDASVSGGTSPYTYTWSNGAVGQDLSNIPSGTFSLTVTDANSCTATTSATITEPSALLLTGSVNGNNIDISISGGTVPYNYSWSSGDVTQDLANVSSGTYTVTVTDAYNCSISDTFIVNNVGLEQQESIEFQVFPNPAQDLVSIRSSSAGVGNTYCIVDCYGRNVLEGTLTSQENNINIQTLANGLYHVKCGSVARSFLVNH